MKLKKIVLVVLLFSFIILSLVVFANFKALVFNKTIQTDVLGPVTVSQPLWASKGLVIAFVDFKSYSKNSLQQKLAVSGDTIALIDSSLVFNKFTIQTRECLSNEWLSSLVGSLTKAFPDAAIKHTVVAGISEGALLPFLSAQANVVEPASYVSVAFSVQLPKNLVLCPSLADQFSSKAQNLSAVSFKNWQVLWADQPDSETGVFIKALGTVNTQIAPYDTPLDTLLLSALTVSVNTESPPMPVVEIPVKADVNNVTLFYSGDGGWRDLDRTIAGEMAALNYPVVGVDVLRYFWAHKSPEQAATDLSATMAYYRQNWHVKRFVLTGYSFGADILPVLYNRLPQQDKDSVSLLVLIALAKSADFEIHVTGWLGQSAGELDLAPELALIPKNKILCIYGSDEKAETACLDIDNTEAKILELPGGHHFDQDYPKLTQKILDVYQQKGIQ